MPYAVRRGGSCPDSKPFGVVKVPDGKVMGCHESKAAAQAQVKALYANEKSNLAQNSNKQEAEPKNQVMSAKELHDLWLEQKPEGASHPEDCPLCQEEDMEQLDEDPAGGAGNSMSDKTYTEEQVALAIAEAVKPLEEKITTLEAADAQAETEARIQEVRAELEAKVSELESTLDVKTAEAEAAQQEVKDIQEYLEAENSRLEEEAAKEQRKGERVEQVKQLASYSDEYVSERADRWAAMPDEEFASFIDDLKAAGVKPKEKVDDQLPNSSELSSASRETASAQSTSSLSVLREAREAGVDVRRI